MLMNFIPNRIKYLLILFLGLVLGYLAPKKPKIVTKIITHTKIVQEHTQKNIENSSKSKIEKKIVTVKENFCPNGNLKSQIKTEEFLGSQTFDSSNLDSTTNKNTFEQLTSTISQNEKYSPNWLMSFQIPIEYKDYKNYQIGIGYEIFRNIDITASTNLKLKQFYFGGQIHF